MVVSCTLCAWPLHCWKSKKVHYTVFPFLTVNMLGVIMIMYGDFSASLGLIFNLKILGFENLPVVVKSHWIRLLGCIGIQFMNIRYYLQCCFVPWVLWYCWLGASKSSRSVKIEWWGADVVISLELGAGCLHMVQLMPLHPKIPSTLASFKPSLFYVCATSLPRLSWKRGY